MKTLTLWFFSTLLAYLVISMILPANVELQTSLSAAIQSVFPQVADTTLFLAVITAGLFTLVVAIFDFSFRRTQVEEPVRQNIRPPRPVQQAPYVTPQPEARRDNVLITPPPVAPTPRPRAKKAVPALELRSFKLVAGSNGIYRIVDRGDVRTRDRIRPIIGVVVNNNDMVSKSLVLQFDLVNPQNKTVQRIAMKHVLKKGLNIVTPVDTEFAFGPKVSKGLWKLRLWAGKYEWAQFLFSFSRQALDELTRHISADMEMDAGALQAANEIAENFSIDDLLNM